ncbi:transposase [Metarhizium brunneum]
MASLFILQNPNDSRGIEKKTLKRLNQAQNVRNVHLRLLNAGGSRQSRESSPSDELLIASQLSATADTVHDTVRAPEAIVTRVTKPARRDSPEAIYQAYLQAREKWYSTQSDGRKKTDKSYREASKLPHSYSEAQYKWCEDWKEMGQFCTSSGAMRRWTREEKMAYIDWSYAEDQRVEAIVAAEMANDTRETTRRGVDAIYDLIERDDLEQDALFEASIGAA